MKHTTTTTEHTSCVGDRNRATLFQVLAIFIAIIATLWIWKKSNADSAGAYTGRNQLQRVGRSLQAVR